MNLYHKYYIYFNKWYIMELNQIRRKFWLLFINFVNIILACLNQNIQITATDNSFSSITDFF